MYEDADLLPISALQHIIFCERQCALIHLEGLWDDNRLTIEGSHMHRKAHQSGTESRGHVRIARGVALRCLRLGLVGFADVVEFHRRGIQEEEQARPTNPNGTLAVTLPGIPGRWTPFPVEYKRGKPKTDRCDEIQLCAQALCLEEMLIAEVPEGSLFYGSTQRRLRVQFDARLRSETEETSMRLRRLIESRKTPPAVWGSRCEQCSLLDLCIPKRGRKGGSALRYVKSALEGAKSESGEPS